MIEFENGFVLVGDVLENLRDLGDESVRCVVTSPPYWGLRDYGVGGQIGLEKTPEEYVEKMVDIFREVRRVLIEDGTLWINLGDSYNAAGRKGHGTSIGYKQGTNRASALEQDHVRPSAAALKQKDLIGIPWRVALALQADGWYLRQDIIWHKPNPMPESVRDRCTKSHEYIFLMSKSPKYYFDHEAIKEPAKYKGPQKTQKRGEFGGKGGAKKGLEPFRAVTTKRNRRDVWSITTKPFKGAHFAVFPPDLVEPCVLAGSAPGDIVLDPFFGSGTTGVVASKLGRSFVGIELNPEYAEIAQKRIQEEMQAT